MHILDELFSLDGTSMDMTDLGVGSEGQGDTTNFDELYFGGGDTEMGGMDDPNDAYYSI